MKILIVDDARPNQMLLRAAINASRSVDIEVAGNGLDALKLVQSSPPFDLIFMDCQMPVMDGLEATKAIREIESESPDRPRQPIIALTARYTETEELACKEAGMDGYLNKPYTPQELDEALNRWLGELQD